MSRRCRLGCCSSRAAASRARRSPACSATRTPSRAPPACSASTGCCSSRTPARTCSARCATAASPSAAPRQPAARRVRRHRPRDPRVGAPAGRQRPRPAQRRAQARARRRGQPGRPAAARPRSSRSTTTLQDDPAARAATRYGSPARRCTGSSTSSARPSSARAASSRRRPRLLAMATDHAKWSKALKDSLDETHLTDEAAEALRRLLHADEGMRDTARGLRELVEGHLGQIARVRDDCDGPRDGPGTPGLRRPAPHRPRRRDGHRQGRPPRAGRRGRRARQAGARRGGRRAQAPRHQRGRPRLRDARSNGVPRARRAQATVRVAARSSGGTVVIEVSDDGAGIDEDRRPGQGDRDAACSPPTPRRAARRCGSCCSSPPSPPRASVTETSGRGVGLDVVQSAAEELGGNVEVISRRGPRHDVPHDVAGDARRAALPGGPGRRRGVRGAGAGRRRVDVAARRGGPHRRRVPRSSYDTARTCRCSTSARPSA